jgi:hypothetical protein
MLVEHNEETTTCPDLKNALICVLIDNLTYHEIVKNLIYDHYYIMIQTEMTWIYGYLYTPFECMWCYITKSYFRITNQNITNDLKEPFFKSIKKTYDISTQDKINFILYIIMYESLDEEILNNKHIQMFSFEYKPNINDITKWTNKRYYGYLLQSNLSVKFIKSHLDDINKVFITAWNDYHSDDIIIHFVDKK